MDRNAPLDLKHRLAGIDNSLKIDSYISADLSEFIRQKILKQNYSFSYETVMSDEKKIDFLKILLHLANQRYDL